MALVVIPCANIIKLKRFIEAVSFSSASTVLLPQLSFEHAQVDVDENSYLLISGSIPEKFLSAVQDQIIMTVQSLESSLMSSFMLGGTVIDDFSSETGRMCLVKCAEESLKIFLIEVHGDNALNLNNNSSRHQRFKIFTEWACRGSSGQRFNDLNKNSDTMRNRRITFDTSGTSTDSEFSAGDVGGGRETTKSTLIRALNAVQNSQVAPYTYSRDSKSKITALSSESSYRKILLASKQSNAVTAAADRDLNSPTRSPNNQGLSNFDNDVHSDCPKRSRKNSESENERRSSQNYRADFDMSESDRAIDQERENSRENEKDCKKGWNAENVGTRIPSLELSLLHDGAYRNMTANSPKPIPFENEFFAGHLLLLVNTKPICAQYFKRFEGHQYTFDMQVQGKFKSIPKGSMFMGAEITKKMELGLFTKGICSSILQIVRAVNPYLHHSFGDKKDYELPHIVGPMWSLFDRLEITPPGGKIPEIGGLLDEDAGHRIKRRKTPNFHVDVNTYDTYSMSFKTSSLELVDWTIVKVPVMGEMDLHAFWGDADLRLIAYMVPDSAAAGDMGSNGLPKNHPQESNKYLFSIDVKHESNHPEMGLNSSAVVLEASSAPSSSPSPEDPNTALSLSRRKNKGEISPGRRGLAPSRQFHSVYQDKEVSVKKLNKQRVRSSSYGREELKISEDGKERTDDEEDDEEHSTASYDSSDDEDDEEVEEEEEDKFYSADEGYDTFHPDDGEGEGEGTGSDSDQNSRLNALRPKMRKSRIRSEMSIKISPYLRGFGQRPVSDTVSPKGKKGQGLQDLSNAPPVVLAAIEVDERRIGRPKGRRFLYAFLQNPPCPGAGTGAGAAAGTGGGGGGAGAESVDLVTAPSSSSWNSSNSSSGNGNHNMSGSSSGSGSGGNTNALNSTAGCGRDTTTTTSDTDTPTDLNNHVRMCSLRSYMEWTSAMPKLDNFVKPPNYKRMSEIGRRRYTLNQFYAHANTLGCGDPSMKYEVQKFLLVTKDATDIHENFLTKSPSGLLNGLQAKRLRTGLAPFLMDSLVCVQLGNYHWSEECLGLTVGDLIFIKHSNRLRGAIRLCLPLNTIIEVRSCNLSDVSIALPDCYPLIVSTFSRQYTILLRGEENRNKWVSAILTANPCISSSSSQYYTGSSNSSSGVTGQGQGQGQGNVGIAFGLDVQASDEETVEGVISIRDQSHVSVQNRQCRRHSEPNCMKPSSLGRATVSERSLPTYDNPSSDAEGGREGGAREDYGETDTQASVGQSSVDDASESSSGSSLVPLPAPLRQPQSLTSVTVFQATPSHLAQASSSSSGSGSGGGGGVGSRTSEPACLRPRFHSDCIDTNTFNTSKTLDDNDDSKDDSFIEIKRTPSFLQKITGKGKSPLRTPDKDKKGLFSIFKRKKQLGFADDVICKINSSDGSPPGPSLSDCDNRLMDSLPNRMNKNKSPPSNTIGISNSSINSNTKSMSNSNSKSNTNNASSSSSSSGSGSGSGRGVNRMDGESSVCDVKDTASTAAATATGTAAAAAAAVARCRSSSIGFGNGYPGRPDSDPRGAFSRTRSFPRPEGLKAINTNLPVSGKGVSAEREVMPRSLVTSPSSMSIGHVASNYNPKHLDLLVKPKGWKLGDKIILNARTFTRGTAAHVYSRDRDREKDRDRDEEKGREADKDKDKDKDREKGAVKDKDKGDIQPLYHLLDKPHQLVAALLKLAFALSNAVNEEPPTTARHGNGSSRNSRSVPLSPSATPRDGTYRTHPAAVKEDTETSKGAERGSQDQHDSNTKYGREIKYGRENRKEGRSDSFVELSRTVFDWKESQIVNDSSNNNTNQSHRSVYNRESSCRSNSNSNNNSPQPVQRNRNSTVTCDNYGNNHQTSGNNVSGLNPHHAGMSSFYHTPNTHTADDLHNDYMSDEVQALWIQFMDGVALLQAADVSHLNPASDEALCMFLNLYHLMVIHSCLVIGPPCSAYKWVGFFGYVSYEVFGDFISIAELEHCILRNDMSRPKVGMFAKYVIPQTSFDFALHRKDFRLIWAINCGSYSLVPLVPVYEAHLLDAQLDAVMRLSMPLHIILGDNGSVSLPITCQWFSKDLEEAAASSASLHITNLIGSSPSLSPPVAVGAKNPLGLLVKYCKGAQLQSLNRLLSKKQSVNIKYSAYAYRCRFFQQLTELDVVIANSNII